MEMTLEKTYDKEYTIRSVEMDSEYRLKKIEAVRFFQETFALCCKDHKVAAFDIIGQNLIWVLAQMKIEYTDEMPKWSEDITVKFWFSEIGKLKIFAEFLILRQNKVVAKGDSLWFLLNSETKRPVCPMPTLESMNVNEETVFGAHTKFINPENGELINKANYKVGIFDIDFNHHLNSLRYIYFAIRTLGEDFLRTRTVKSFAVQFKKECFLDDEIESSAYRKDEQNMYFILRRKSDNMVVCEINMVLV